MRSESKLRHALECLLVDCDALYGWEIEDRLRDIIALPEEKTEGDALAECRALIAECLALNPMVVGGLKTVHTWNDVLCRMREQAALAATGGDDGE